MGDEGKEMVMVGEQGWAFSGLLTYVEAKRPLPKLCHAYLTLMKLGKVILDLKNIQRIYESRDISIFHRKQANFAISRNTDIDCILVHDF